jgi:hypothetical protein
MVQDIADAGIDHVGVVYNGSLSDLLHKLIPDFAFTIGPVVYTKERIPAEYQRRIRFLLKIRNQCVGIEVLVVADLYPVSGKTTFIILKYSGSTAG